MGAHRLIALLHSTRPPPNGVVVFDIDGTLLDEQGEPKRDVIQAYWIARRRGFIPVIITARRHHPEVIQFTRQQLHRHGITDYATIYFMPMDVNDQGLYKLLARRDIHFRGGRVVASIGDMPWDIGQYGGAGFIVA